MGFRLAAVEGGCYAYEPKELGYLGVVTDSSVSACLIWICVGLVWSRQSIVAAIRIHLF